MGTENRSQRNEYYSVCNEQGGLRNENQSLCNDQRFPYKNTAVSLQKHSAFTTKTQRFHHKNTSRFSALLPAH
jgi:hypothetical protein